MGFNVFGRKAPPLRQMLPLSPLPPQLEYLFHVEKTNDTASPLQLWPCLFQLRRPRILISPSGSVSRELDDLRFARGLVCVGLEGPEVALFSSWLACRNCPTHAILHTTRSKSSDKQRLGRQEPRSLCSVNMLVPASFSVSRPPSIDRGAFLTCLLLFFLTRQFSRCSASCVVDCGFAS